MTLAGAVAKTVALKAPAKRAVPKRVNVTKDNLFMTRSISYRDVRVKGYFEAKIMLNTPFNDVFTATERILYVFGSTRKMCIFL